MFFSRILVASVVSVCGACLFVGWSVRASTVPFGLEIVDATAATSSLSPSSGGGGGGTGGGSSGSGGDGAGGERSTLTEAPLAVLPPSVPEDLPTLPIFQPGPTPTLPNAVPLSLPTIPAKPRTPPAMGRGERQLSERLVERAREPLPLFQVPLDQNPQLNCPPGTPPEACGGMNRISATTNILRGRVSRPTTITARKRVTVGVNQGSIGSSLARSVDAVRRVARSVQEAMKLVSTSVQETWRFLFL